MERSYLFLQGPHGPFFKQLGRRLTRKGAKVLRVNFNGGDWIDWFGSDVINFTGTQKQWDRFFGKLCMKHGVTDLIVYGDCRTLHSIAIKRAQEVGIRVHVFEEGYIRPNWITLERDGVNGHSPLMPDQDALIKLHDTEQEEKPRNAEKVGPATRWVIFYCLRYYLFKTFLLKRFQNYILHRPYRPAQELLLWISSLLHSPLQKYRSLRSKEELYKSQKHFYLVCLQLDSDAQIRVHSNYLSMANFINEVLRSFAEHAPKDSLLVFKKHPLDPDAIAYGTLVRLEAYSLGIRDRVIFLHYGNLPELIQNSEGVVLMNSTVGTSALHHGKPTIVLGEAIYNIPGLTWQGGLESFWTEGTPPESLRFEAFKANLFDQCLLHGGFYTSHGRRYALEGSLQRLLHPVDKIGHVRNGTVIPLNDYIRSR